MVLGIHQSKEDLFAPIFRNFFCAFALRHSYPSHLLMTGRKIGRKLASHHFFSSTRVSFCSSDSWSFELNALGRSFSGAPGMVRLPFENPLGRITKDYDANVRQQKCS